ncbi:DEHA2F22066p [Debaryomyces hansenii CBS767]|uniref:DEHA2F22066p n=1 Tax=Debaryomyces hansenii (strain ATCC 36239 / CBS 767 / BCRC 21394 / JCM 1990 / NBRC 0083 / IGC 2968) TaxID=284592 RepID=Q6BKG9_DEBHA|nr:DEHA2F22066p [Debaryomyces hansenii CBS767]CAG89703.2 DEHA2F22066p [Debaryomyces hansenii CBS767]|eukprot:XP_461302.2 DEHA2F22066p [Debaryomyces hansenii CBS767]
MSKFILPNTLRELRFHLSQTGEASIPLRKFLTANYPSLKTQSNYKLPILIRESYGIPPSITARFEKGMEIKNNVEGLDEKGIEGIFKDLLKN